MLTGVLYVERPLFSLDVGNNWFVDIDLRCKFNTLGIRNNRLVEIKDTKEYIVKGGSLDVRCNKIKVVNVGLELSDIYIDS